MEPFQGRKKLRKLLYSKITLVVLFGLVLLLANGAFKVHQKAAIAAAERNEAQKKIDELEGRAAELRENITRFKTEQGLESELRKRFLVARDGEEVVVVVDETTKKGENNQAQTGFWQRFLGILGI